MIQTPTPGIPLMSKVMMAADVPIRLKLISERGNTAQFHLATENGIPLPGQRSVSIDSGIDDVTIITVQFVVNNSTVWIEG